MAALNGSKKMRLKGRWLYKNKWYPPCWRKLEAAHDSQTTGTRNPPSSETPVCRPWGVTVWGACRHLRHYSLIPGATCAPLASKKNLSPNTAKCSPGDKALPVENHSLRPNISQIYFLKILGKQD